VKTRIAGVVVLCFVFGSCTPKPSSTPQTATPAAKVENRVKETDLTTITITEKAEQRLGIEVTEAVARQASGASSIAGELTIPPGKVLIVTAPVTGSIEPAARLPSAGQVVRAGETLVRLRPLLGPQRDLKVTYDADADAAKSRLDAATQQLQRARQLLRDMAGSKRNVEAAELEYEQAKANYDAAAARLERLRTHPLEADVTMTIPAPRTGILRQIMAAPGQTVAGGAPLFEVADLSSLWLRVPVYAGDLKTIGLQSSVAVRDMDGGGSVRTGKRVAAPPSADPLAITADIYFEVANGDGQLRPGQKLSVTLPSTTAGRDTIVVPVSAILYDIQGGVWVYVSEKPRVYRRQRVELLRTENKAAFLTRGLAAGVKVVTAGAAELFGTEFGAGK